VLFLERVAPISQGDLCDEYYKKYK
jgi:hypothetical protein